MSKNHFTFTDLLLIGVMILSFSLLPWIAVSHAAEKDKATTPVYKPPVKGVPTRRVGGGTRGIYPETSPIDEPPILAVLAPEHTGQTTQSQPVLYWAVSRELDKLFMFTLVHADPMMLGASTQPLLEVPIQNTRHGIQAFDLSNHQINLEPEVEYQWAITLVTDESRQPSSKDIIATGTILRINPSEQLVTTLKDTEKNQLPFIYAEQGLWYDAIASVSALIDTHPEENIYKAQRIALLEQVGLAKYVTP